jgi:hypothetical protein
MQLIFDLLANLSGFFSEWICVQYLDLEKDNGNSPKQGLLTRFMSSTHDSFTHCNMTYPDLNGPQPLLMLGNAELLSILHGRMVF